VGEQSEARGKCKRKRKPGLARQKLDVLRPKHSVPTLVRCRVSIGMVRMSRDSQEKVLETNLKVYTVDLGDCNSRKKTQFEKRSCYQIYGTDEEWK
jgi:hypothetical protein